MTIILALLLIGFLIFLIGWCKAPPFLAFAITSVIGGVSLGMPLQNISQSIEHGIGDMLGGLTAIICLGAMFGKSIAESGAAQRITGVLIGGVSPRFITVALAAAGLIIGIPLFYTVGFVIVTPLIYSIEKRTRHSAVFVGVPLLCGLSVAHGFLPPHPSPMALIKLFGADTGLTLLYGLIVGGVSLMIAGPLFAQTLKTMSATKNGDGSNSPRSFLVAADLPDDRLPGTVNSFVAVLLPVLLISASTLVAYLPIPNGQIKSDLTVFGQPAIVLLLSLLYSTLTLGRASGRTLRSLMLGYGESLKDVSGVLLVLAGAGALKQVFADSGVSAALAAWLETLPLEPLVLGWLIASVIRIALGSATIAGLTAGGIMAPVVATSHVNPNLMVLSVGAGSLMCSHVNDAGFWMFKEYFNLSLKDTFRSWTVMESLVGGVGLLCALGLNAILPAVR